MHDEYTLDWSEIYSISCTCTYSFAYLQCNGDECGGMRAGWLLGYE